jgi:hypothetical protein
VATKLVSALVSRTENAAYVCGASFRTRSMSSESELPIYSVSRKLWLRRRGDPGGEVGCVGCLTSITATLYLSPPGSPYADIP